MSKIKIDPEFAALIPSLSGEERAQLEANIKVDGCRDVFALALAREMSRKDLMRNA